MKYLQLLAASLILSVAATPALATDRLPGHTPNLPQGWVWPPSPAMLTRRDACVAELHAAGVEFERVPPAGGQVMTPVVVPSGRFGPLQVASVFNDRPPVMDCELALALAHEAQALVDLGVRTLLVGRVYHDRLAVLRGRSVNLRSRHSLGLAVDVRGFITQGGRRLTVLRHYNRPVVREVERHLLESERFRAVVTPHNDRAHRDHFHLSAKLNLDPAAPEPRVDVRDLLRVAHNR